MHYGKCWTAISKAFAVAAITVGLAASSFGAGSETVFHTFVNRSDGSLPFGGLTIDAKEIFTARLTWAVPAHSPRAQFSN
jgi:hypothetical protein